jgi:beta-catenin-like protein 1
LAALNAKLQGGGDICHRAASIIAYVCANSKRCHGRILSQLILHQSGISLIKAALSEFQSSLKEGSRQKKNIENLIDLI